MKIFHFPRICMAAAMGLFLACSASKPDNSKAPHSNDILELLTGFGESLSKRNFVKAVDYMVPEEKALVMEGGKVPAEKQKALLALPLQRLIRHPSIRVENGKIAGLYAMLPSMQMGAVESENPDALPPDAGAETAPETLPSPMDTTGMEASASSGPAPTAEEGEGERDLQATGAIAPNDPKLKETVNRFFTAVNRKNWPSALALMNDGEKKMLLDEKGRLKESSKQRLMQIDQKNKEALILQDGKLSGVTLLLPSD